MNLNLKTGAILFGIIALGVAAGFKVNELINRAKMPATSSSTVPAK